MKKQQPAKLFILLVFLLITIALLIAVSIYCYLIRYKAKQNIHCHVTSQIANWQYKLKWVTDSKI